MKLPFRGKHVRQTKIKRMRATENNIITRRFQSAVSRAGEISQICSTVEIEVETAWFPQSSLNFVSCSSDLAPPRCSIASCQIAVSNQKMAQAMSDVHGILPRGNGTFGASCAPHHLDPAALAAVSSVMVRFTSHDTSRYFGW